MTELEMLRQYTVALEALQPLAKYDDAARTVVRMFMAGLPEAKAWVERHKKTLIAAYVDLVGFSLDLEDKYRKLDRYTYDETKRLDTAYKRNGELAGRNSVLQLKLSRARKVVQHIPTGKLV